MGDHKHLRFDFAIFDSNNLKCLIECDGDHHFDTSTFYSNVGNCSFEKIKEYDDRKNNYCIENNIKLIRIPYKSHKKIQLEELK